MSKNIETPEGWERRDKFLFRQYGESFATIVRDDEEDWAVNVSLPDGGSNQDWYGSLDKAIAEANEQLGVPKPVEVVEEKFADGSYVFKDKEYTRWATVSKALGRWYVSNNDGGRAFGTEAEACEASRRYVRGDA